jgi:hypothetical protein
MLKFARLHRPLSVLPLLAALASAAPLVRWCPMPWSQVTVENFVACDSGARECAGAQEEQPSGAAAQSPACEASGSTPCPFEPANPSTHGCPLPGCAKGCPLQAASSSSRAFCLEAPFTATPGRGAPALDPPPALPAELVANLLPESAGELARTRLVETARPHSPPRSLPPPVRGPPCMT